MPSCRTPGGTLKTNTIAATPEGLNLIELPHNSVRSTFDATEIEAIK